MRAATIIPHKPPNPPQAALPTETACAGAEPPPLCPLDAAVGDGCVGGGGGGVTLDLAAAGQDAPAKHALKKADFLTLSPLLAHSRWITAVVYDGAPAGRVIGHAGAAILFASLTQNPAISRLALERWVGGEELRGGRGNGWEEAPDSASLVSCSCLPDSADANRYRGVARPSP